MSDDLVDWRSGFDATSDLMAIVGPRDGSLIGRRALGGQMWALVDGSEVVLNEFDDPAATG